MYASRASKTTTTCRVEDGPVGREDSIALDAQALISSTDAPLLGALYRTFNDTSIIPFALCDSS